MADDAAADAAIIAMQKPDTIRARWKREGRVHLRRKTRMITPVHALFDDAGKPVD
jgi:hypothetical protein